MTAVSRYSNPRVESDDTRTSSTDAGASEPSYQYSIVVCNLNMAATLEQSLRSILDQTDSDYEILVVDGGSTDGSQAVLAALEADYDRLRVIHSPDTNPGTLAADRNTGVQFADAEHVLLQLDADDEYAPIIPDFTTIYSELRRHRDRDFYFSASGLNIAPRDFLLPYGPYRERIHRAEDADMWRRMLADDAFIHLDHAPACTSLGYDPGRLDLIKNRYSEVTGDLLAGVTLTSRVQRALYDRPLKMTAVELGVLPLAAVTAARLGRYDLPEDYRDARELSRAIDRRTRTLADLEAAHPGFDVELSEHGKAVFRNPEGDG